MIRLFYACLGILVGLGLSLAASALAHDPAECACPDLCAPPVLLPCTISDEAQRAALEARKQIEQLNMPMPTAK